MGWWYRKTEEYQCNDCGEKYEFILDTMFMARNPGLPVGALFRALGY